MRKLAQFSLLAALVLEGGCSAPADRGSGGSRNDSGGQGGAAGASNSSAGERQVSSTGGEVGEGGGSGASGERGGAGLGGEASGGAGKGGTSEVADGAGGRIAGRGGMGGNVSDGGVGTAGASQGGKMGGGGAGGGAGGEAGLEVNSCPGYTLDPLGELSCYTNADCIPGYWCYPPGQSAPKCGSCETAVLQCDVDWDCGEAKVCEPYLPTCACSGPGTMCVAACTADSCAGGTRCGSTGRCEPTPCDEGFACAADQVCTPDAATVDVHGCAPGQCDEGVDCAADERCAPTADDADEHGCELLHCSDGSYTCLGYQECIAGSGGHECRPASCTTDSDCGCGVCLSNSCSPELGTCQYVPM